MLSNDALNTIILGVLLAAAVGTGVFVTQKSQPARLKHLEQEEKAYRLRQAEVTDLLVMQAGSEAQAEEALRRWNARYKVLPEYLSSPAVVAYLNQLSSHGFRSFDISFGGVERRSHYSVLTYQIRGTGFFEALYDFIWEVENGRGLYRISDLTLREVAEEGQRPPTEIPRRQQMVQFSLRLEAYFGGTEGMSAPDQEMSVPDFVLPPRHLGINPFYPLILAELPPNVDGLVDVELDELVSVVGDAAIFRTAAGRRTVRQGERVYLGRITRVDPLRARVLVDLNKGGIREQIELELATGERHTHSRGLGIQIIPLSAPRPERPSPPQPGTPEYRRLFGEGPWAPPAEPAEPAEAGVPVRPTTPSAVEAERGLAIRPFPVAPRPDTDKEP